MREEIIRTIKNTARCKEEVRKDGVSALHCVLQNPEEVADAVLKVIFGEDILEVMLNKINPDEVITRWNKKHRDRKMVKAKK